jgi:hypothetical protein
VPPELIEGAGPIILFQTWNLICFLAVVMLAVWFRTRSWLHRRLMLIASIQIIGAALTTNRMFGAMLQSLFPDSISVPLLLGLLLAIALPVFDYVSARKVYAVSVIGAGRPSRSPGPGGATPESPSSGTGDGRRT